jgi:long-chain fatty acid transport protein
MSTTRYLAMSAVLLACGSASAGGLSLNDFGARASGKGTAMVAITDDPSGIFFNPANIGFTQGLDLDIGLGAAMPKYKYSTLSGDYSAKTNTALVPIPWMSAALNAGSLGKYGDIALGLGFYVPMGSGFEWPAGWAGDQKVRRIELEVFDINPTIAWRLGKAVSVGVGWNYLPSAVYLSQGLSFGSEASGSVELSGSGSGTGWNAGITIVPTDYLSLGLSWRQGPTLDLSGTAAWHLPTPFQSGALGDKVSTKIHTADFYRFGFALKPIANRLTLAFDMEKQMWSNLKSLDIVFTDASGKSTTQASAKDSRDSSTYHFGAELKVTDALAVRAGYLYDQYVNPESTVNPAPPDSDQQVWSVGLSYYFGDVMGLKNFGVHVYFEDVIFSKRTTVTSDFPGVYEGGFGGGTYALLYGLGFSGSFDLGLKSTFGGGQPAVASATPGRE